MDVADIGQTVPSVWHRPGHRCHTGENRVSHPAQIDEHTPCSLSARHLYTLCAKNAVLLKRFPREIGRCVNVRWSYAKEKTFEIDHWRARMI
jgi:hypothetical protein